MMTQKETYEKPQMEIIHFETEDVIKNSGGDITGGTGGISANANNGGWGA